MAWPTAGGHEVEARADEFFAAFESPRAGVDAAVACSTNSSRVRGSTTSTCKVRIGIHSGYPTSTETNYVGMDVNTASRITAVGHGGQVAGFGQHPRRREVVGAGGDIRFKALGSHKLRGLPEAVPLFQVAAKGLPSRFPPLRT